MSKRVLRALRGRRSQQSIRPVAPLPDGRRLGALDYRGARVEAPLKSYTRDAERVVCAAPELLRTCVEVKRCFFDTFDAVGKPTRGFMLIRTRVITARQCGTSYTVSLTRTRHGYSYRVDGGARVGKTMTRDEATSELSRQFGAEQAAALMTF